MDETPTCGKGIAENAALPAKLADVVGALGRVLEHHMTALDLADASSRMEYEAYANLSARCQLIARDLETAGTAMAGYRDLPMGRHDESVMSSQTARNVFRELVTHETELLALLEQRVPRHRKLLAEMGTS